MTQVKLNEAMSGHAEGASIEVTPGAALHLIEAGVAEEVKASPKRGTKADPKAAAEEGGGDPLTEDPLTAG
ncbi:hypothetical protein [Arthrobacter sp. GMC3]|uniref:hypothetical protein n=1 Tax=Arthrobacter sp. GMC3 TaxID=2058894 RepID=UPI000CE2F024|nr:hypothetical protein [Arthrobacter sp. GMC3]